jgi:hypothetical protein
VIAAKAFEKRIRTAFGPSADPEAPATPSSDARLDLQLNERVAAIRRIVSGRVVFTTNFGIEDQAIAHAIFSQGLSIDVVALDTGRLFPETFDLWARTEHRYAQRIVAAYPDRTGLEPLVGHQGINGFIASIEARHACCAVRKAEPLRRALAGAVAWITGLRAGQSDERVAASFAIVAPRHRLIKVNPLFDWSPSRWSRSSGSTTFPIMLSTNGASLRSAAHHVRAPWPPESRSAPGDGGGSRNRPLSAG